MRAEWIQPFLQSASTVIEQIVQVRPSRGELQMLSWSGTHDFRIQVGLTGQLSGQVAFGLNEDVALKMASAMMGGSPLASLDAIGESAISELGNMISGNATSLMYNQGISVDITPPQLLISADHPGPIQEVLAVPLLLDGIGRFDVLMHIG
ncbi:MULTISPECIES: chemotaxis protein CheX [Paenibacillus]|uniref:Chemotaxis protein CheX n=3 Tax=Paenibacillus TaxID=44249 RepID=A0AAJ2K4I6_9BACL|nr:MULTISPECIES: chemotaxis protein CheX [Paenibacillus]EPY14410.1 chemotaxis protein CheC [Paenibacillus alvei A6-6i-x]MCM3292000.1 chemotaxis protein CheX [Paenibacillus sp. MER 180]MCY9533149.1 chemotaxis protein CheX [Paenibacillus alvei]MDT8979628.1 chemotaxis protein CheX [Paenibacillus sp. chi10]OBY79822.1 chemotaxis protein CheC [Paenibacillus sp. KS1]